MFIASKLVLMLSLVTLGLSNPVKRSVTEVKAAVVDLGASVQALDASIDAWPATGGTTAMAVAINNSGKALIMDLDELTASVVATGAINEADGSEILSSFESFVPSIERGLVNIVAIKPTFTALPVPGLAASTHANLVSLKAGAVTFLDTLTANTPATLHTKVASIKSDVSGAFDIAIAGYA
ncbi:hypothetical protein B0H34DRAFT_802666 [Crassisporium funariophilum]|nr:hypothetical protein B0H34DRAFT_802666 [Crassisporium funariophilum]